MAFFTTPASQRKRKRTEGASSAPRRRDADSNASRPQKTARRAEREESISGSESSDGGREGFFDGERDNGEMSYPSTPPMTDGEEVEMGEKSTKTTY